MPPDISINHLQELLGVEEGDEKFLVNLLDLLYLGEDITKRIIDLGSLRGRDCFPSFFDEYPYTLGMSVDDILPGDDLNLYQSFCSIDAGQDDIKCDIHTAIYFINSDDQADASITTIPELSFDDTDTADNGQNASLKKKKK